MKAASINKGFTLLEILIVVAIIGLLAGLGLPHILTANRLTRSRIFVNDIRVASDAFTQFFFDNNQYPTDKTPRQIPIGMSSYLSNVQWSEKTTIGGYWDWDYDQFGVTAAVSVYHPTFNATEMAKIDAIIDDGILDSGHFRARTGGYMYVIKEQDE